MGLAGSQRTGVGSVLTAGGGDDGGDGPDTSDLWTFDLALSFGHGEHTVDDNVPDVDGEAQPFWLSPTTDADHATPDQGREWPLGDDEDISYVRLIVQVDAADLADDGGQIIVTINGQDTAIAVSIAEGTSENLTLSAEGAVYAPAGYKIGARFAPGEDMSGGTLRCEARLRGRLADPLPEPAPDMWLWLKSTAGMPDGVGNTLPFEDQSGNQRDAQFGGAATLVENAIDGLPGIDLPKSGPLTGAYITQDVADGFGPDVPFYVALVCVPQDDQGGPAFLLPSMGVNTLALLQVPWIDSEHGPPDVQKGLTYEKFNYPSQEFPDGPIDYTGQPCLFEFISEDGATLEIRVNGVARALTDDTIPPWGGNGTTRYSIGAFAEAPYFLKCDMVFAEIIVRNVVSAAKLALDREYFAARYPSLGLP